MNKNWFIIYTKKDFEKKVSSLLTKRKIENLLPVNCRQVEEFKKNKLRYEPLIPGYVFVYIPEKDLPLLKQISHVINLVCWKGKPATIGKQEVGMLKEFVGYYRNIKVEKSRVSLGAPEIINEPTYSMNGNNVVVIANLVRLHLPSLGIVISAEHERESTQKTGYSIFSNREKSASDSAKKNLKSSLI